MKFLSIENPSPILKDGSEYHRTQFDYHLPHEKIARLNTIKEAEWNRLIEYHNSDRCLMQFLGLELNDEQIGQCGKCANCLPDRQLISDFDQDLVIRANDFLRNRYIKIKPRATFSSSGDNARQAFASYKLPYRDKNLTCEEGLALSSWQGE